VAPEQLSRYEAPILLVGCAESIVAESIGHHDPQGKWVTGTFHLALEESRPDGSVRETWLVVDNARGRFELVSEREGRSIAGEIDADGCVWRLDGSTDFTAEEREEFGLTCERLERTRNYYVYLWGMPMKLRDPGTRIGEEVKETEFDGRAALEVRVTYSEEVGSDTWYFYFDPGSQALIGYRFYHDEEARDGEYITLEGTAEGAGLRIPMKRAWYMHQEDEYLGTDELVAIGGSEMPWSKSLELSEPVHHLDTLAREPMAVQHPDGTLFVTGYGSQVTGVDPEVVPSLWKSTDDGANWGRVDVGSAAEGAAGNSDVDLTVASDGTLYFLAMGFDRSVGEGTHIAIGVSHDVGESWRWTRLSETRFDDRPWVRIAPGGVAHVIWNDDHGVSYAVSMDRGVSWTERERIHPEGGSSHLAVGPGGEIAVRISPIAASANRFAEGVDLVAVSTDGGESWTKRPAPGTREWDGTFRNPNLIPRWVEPLAWGSDGALYHLWSEGTDVRLGRSVDLGEDWTIWTVSSGAAPAYFPYMVASDSGELAAAWFSGGGEDTAVRLARLEIPVDGETPLVRLSKPFQIDAWAEMDSETPPRTPAGEYVPVLFLQDGRLAVATPIQDVVQDRWGFSWWTTEP
jgi:hypothetical protein